jgi:two-component system nitrate/nitrite response regulator NarL
MSSLQNRTPPPPGAAPMHGAAPRIRVAVAGGHPIFRDGLRRLLDTDCALHLVSEPCEGAGPTRRRELAPDILLLDLTTAGRFAVNRLSELAASGSTVKTIVLTGCVDTPDVLLAIQLGARGVILKDSAPEVLFNSIHSVIAGDFWIGRGPVSEAGKGLRKLKAAQRRNRAFGLTRREIEIARRSSISENTVKSHLMHIFDKLGASNRVELALFAAHHRVLDGV